MEKVIKRFNFIENISICMLVLDLIVSLVLFKYSNYSVKVNCVIFGSLLIVKGLFDFIKYFFDGINSKIFNCSLISGVVGLILGLFLCFYKLETLKIIGILFGIWIIFNGLVSIYHAIVFFKNKDEIAPLVFFSSLLVITMGILAIINPFKEYISVVRLLSVFVFATCILNGMVMFLYKRRAKVILPMFK